MIGEGFLNSLSTLPAAYRLNENFIMAFLKILLTIKNMQHHGGLLCICGDAVVVAGLVWRSQPYG